MLPFDLLFRLRDSQLGVTAIIAILIVMRFQVRYGPLNPDDHGRSIIYGGLCQ